MTGTTVERRSRPAGERFSEAASNGEATSSGGVGACSDPTSDGQVSVLKCHPWIGMLTHTVLEDL